MALTQVAIIKQDRKTVSKTVLVNTKKVIDYTMLSDGTTNFWYDERSDRREGSVECIYNGDRTAFRNLMSREGTGAQYLMLSVTTINGRAPSNLRYEINTDYIIWGEDIDDDSCYLWVGSAFKKNLFKVPYTIDEIDTAASDSGSMSYVNV